MVSLSKYGPSDACVWASDGFLVPACSTIALALPPASLESMKSVYFLRISPWFSVKVDNTIIIDLLNERMNENNPEVMHGGVYGLTHKSHTTIEQILSFSFKSAETRWCPPVRCSIHHLWTNTQPKQCSVSLMAMLQQTYAINCGTYKS